MAEAYAGPFRDGSPAIELQNTIYVADGALRDGLADAGQARAWLEAVLPRLPLDELPPGPAPLIEELVALRDAIRGALRAAVAGDPQDAAVLDAINGASSGAPRSPRAVWQHGGRPQPGIDIHGATRAQGILAALARDAIDLLSGTRHDDLRACGAPGCVLMFLRGDPRREWCSNACGNRARQARHYRRTHGRSPGPPSCSPPASDG